MTLCWEFCWEIPDGLPSRFPTFPSFPRRGKGEKGTVGRIFPTGIGKWEMGNLGKTMEDNMLFEHPDDTDVRYAIERWRDQDYDATRSALWKGLACVFGALAVGMFALACWIPQ